jgi:hypothetical protein
MLLLLLPSACDWLKLCKGKAGKTSGEMQKHRCCRGGQFEATPKVNDASSSNNSNNERNAMPSSQAPLSGSASPTAGFRQASTAQQPAASG